MKITTDVVVSPELYQKLQEQLANIDRQLERILFDVASKTTFGSWLQSFFEGWAYP